MIIWRVLIIRVVRTKRPRHFDAAWRAQLMTTRSQAELGNAIAERSFTSHGGRALRVRKALPARRHTRLAKHSFAPRRIPKRSLGTRRIGHCESLIEHAEYGAIRVKRPTTLRLDLAKK